jgi:hypothetical protein
VVGQAVAAARPMFFFANETVLDFYPRFGFERAECTTSSPSTRSCAEYRCRPNLSDSPSWRTPGT